MAESRNYLESVREQYEELPYPNRNPQDELKRLVTTWVDDLPMINHYCFAGRQGFGTNFRVLVAGGGTGDATIYLAEQLRHANVEIVHVDMSEASIAVAKKRAELRSLNSIRWVHDSLLNLPNLNLGQFDYINCVGVLHHLADPDAGFSALLPLLKPDGAMGVMVYGKIGRTGVYQMQSLLRAINDGDSDTANKIQRAKDVIASAPMTNWFKRGQELFVDLSGNNAEIFDLLLHSQDRAYSVPELYEWIVDKHDLNLHFTDTGRGYSVYVPRLVVGPRTHEYLNRTNSLPLRKQSEIAELLGGTIKMHSFYVTRHSTTEAPYGDADYVPLLIHEEISGAELATFIEHEQKAGPVITINHIHTGIVAEVNAGKYAKYILNNIDGRQTFGEIFEKIRGINKFKKAPPSNDDLFSDFRELFTFLRAIERLLLRHKSVSA